MNIVKRIQLFAVACALLVSFGGLVPVTVMADTAQQTVCNTLGAGKDCKAANPNGSVSIQGLVNTIVLTLSWVIGVVSVIMVMWSGFRYVTSAGDSGRISTAKNTLIYAIIGIVIASLAQFIVHFVLNKVKHAA